MLASLKFRHRVALLALLAATALVTVTAVALLFGARGERQLAGIETRYVPLIELDRDLKAQFAEIARALEDAATAGEDSRLDDADRGFAAMAHHLRAGRQTIADNSGDASVLEAELSAYYANARRVAAALAAGVPAGQLEAQIDQMRRAQETFRAKLDVATAPDRRRLAEAFASARASQRDAIWADIVVGSCALAAIGLLSWRLIRDTVRALHAVSVGVERLARGEFAHEIPVTTRDELGALAREANRTAQRLREYRERADHDAAELRNAATELREANATVEARNATLVAAQQLLEVRAEELARASRYKSEFLANMSHELRTPLNSILVLSKVLAEHAPDNAPADNAPADNGPAEDRERGATTGAMAKQVEFATLIHKSGEELLALINEVLDLSKIEAGKQELTCAALPIAEFRDYMRRMFAPLAAQRQLSFAVECADDLPAAIRTDRARLAQIVKNLIANAFKFTARGGVTVRIARGQRRPGPDAEGPPIPDPIVIAVADTGIGIAADNQAVIFEAFEQADTGISRKYGGTGLGLTIAKQLATRLGGALHVESALGAGSTFSVELPIAGPPAPGDAAAAPDPAAGSPAALPLPAMPERGARTTRTPYLLGTVNAEDPEPALDGKTVLVVDDDMRTVYALTSALTAMRARVLTAADGQEALDELHRNPELDAVLMDVVMPRIDGLEAIRRVRAEERFRDLPIVALTAPATPAERDRFLAAGASDYVAKPVDIAQLLGVLRAWLGPPPSAPRDPARHDQAGIVQAGIVQAGIVK